jgi:hypothetical protein
MTHTQKYNSGIHLDTSQTQSRRRSVTTSQRPRRRSWSLMLLHAENIRQCRCTPPAAPSRLELGQTDLQRCVGCDKGRHQRCPCFEEGRCRLCYGHRRHGGCETGVRHHCHGRQQIQVDCMNGSPHVYFTSREIRTASSTHKDCYTESDFAGMTENTVNLSNS